MDEVTKESRLPELLAQAERVRARLHAERPDLAERMERAERREAGDDRPVDFVLSTS
jgi:hypothetical protein